MYETTKFLVHRLSQQIRQHNINRAVAFSMYRIYMYSHFCTQPQHAQLLTLRGSTDDNVCLSLSTKDISHWRIHGIRITINWDFQLNGTQDSRRGPILRYALDTPSSQICWRCCFHSVSHQVMDGRTNVYRIESPLTTHTCLYVKLLNSVRSECYVYLNALMGYGHISGGMWKSDLRPDLVTPGNLSCFIVLYACFFHTNCALYHPACAAWLRVHGWMNQAYSRLSTTHGHITDCKLVCMQ